MATCKQKTNFESFENQDWQSKLAASQSRAAACKEQPVGEQETL